MAVGSVDQWTGWAPLPGLTLASDKTVTVLHGSIVQVFVVGSDNKLYKIRESSAGSNQWTNWIPISGTKTVTSEPVIGRNQNNKLALFARDADGGLFCLLQTIAGDSQWKVGIPPPGVGKLIGKPAFALTQDARMAVFVRGTDNKLYCTVQGEVNVNDDWSNWFPIDATGTLNGNPVIGKNMDSTLEVFVRGTDNALYHVRQSANTFVWGHWQPLGGSLTSDPVIGKYTDGTLDIVVKGQDNKMFHKWQTIPGNRQWTEWVPLGGSINGKPSVATSRSMMLDVFTRGIGSNDLRCATILHSAP